MSGVGGTPNFGPTFVVTAAGSIGSSEIADNSIVNADINSSAAIAATKIADGSVSSTEFQYLDGVTSAIQTQLNNAKLKAITFTIDGNGFAITTGVKGYLEIPFTGTITGWTLVSDQTGSIVIDVWKDTYLNFPPTLSDTIAGSEKPTISSAMTGQDLTLTTWTTAVTAGDILGFNVDSATTIQRATCIIRFSVT